VREVLFTLVFAAAFSDQSVFLPDPFQSAVAEGHFELADQAAREEFPTPLGNPAQPGGFPLSHSHDRGDHSLRFPNNNSNSLRPFSLKHFNLAGGDTM
jgi:hypothetical protein